MTILCHFFTLAALSSPENAAITIIGSKSELMNNLGTPTESATTTSWRL